MHVGIYTHINSVQIETNQLAKKAFGIALKCKGLSFNLIILLPNTYSPEILTHEKL